MPTAKRAVGPYDGCTGQYMESFDSGRIPFILCLVVVDFRHL